MSRLPILFSVIFIVLTAAMFGRQYITAVPTMTKAKLFMAALLAGLLTGIIYVLEVA